MFGLVQTQVEPQISLTYIRDEMYENIGYSNQNDHDYQYYHGIVQEMFRIQWNQVVEKQQTTWNNIITIKWACFVCINIRIITL